MSPGTENRDGLFWARIDILAQKKFLKNFQDQKLFAPMGTKYYFGQKWVFDEMRPCGIKYYFDQNLVFDDMRTYGIK